MRESSSYSSSSLTSQAGGCSEYGQELSHNIGTISNIRRKDLLSSRHSSDPTMSARQEWANTLREEKARCQNRNTLSSEGVHNDSYALYGGNM